MWHGASVMFGGVRFPKAAGVRVIVPKAALRVVFDECDRYDADETGGRILGTYDQVDRQLEINVTGIIEPGPAARRTATYFKQDGEHQEKVFREVEAKYPAVEHLGNWHTHHVNGLRHLSGGDLETYTRIVNHGNHNTDFFYALLVIEKRHRKADLDRYVVKHYLMRRGADQCWEIPPSNVTMTDAPLVWPVAPTASLAAHRQTAAAAADAAPAQVGGRDATSRLFDTDAVARFFPLVKPFMSQQLGLIWRGPMQLVDGSEVEVVVVEQSLGQAYVAAVRKAPPVLEGVSKVLGESTFGSCREALIHTERMCNSAVFERERQR